MLKKVCCVMLAILFVDCSSVSTKILSIHDFSDLLDQNKDTLRLIYQFEKGNIKSLPMHQHRLSYSQKEMEYNQLLMELEKYITNHYVSFFRDTSFQEIQKPKGIDQQDHLIGLEINHDGIKYNVTAYQNGILTYQKIPHHIQYYQMDMDSKEKLEDVFSNYQETVDALKESMF